MLFDFNVMVWGEANRDIYLHAALPSHLANLRSWAYMGASVYRLYTTQADLQYMQAASAFQELIHLIDVEPVFIETEIGPSKWDTVRHCHRDQVRRADERGAALFFLCADQVWSSTSFAFAAARLIEGGCDAVVCAGPRAVREQVLPRLLGMGSTGRDLVRLLLDHPHQETLDWHWDSSNYFQYPTYVYFAVPDGLWAFCYIMHPVVVKPWVRQAPFNRVFDQDWLAAAVPNPQRIYVAQDSDEVCHIELSPGDMELPSQPDNPHMDPVQALTWYAEATYNAHHRWFAHNPVLLHAGPLIGHAQEIRYARNRGVNVVNSIAAGLALSDEQLMGLNPENLMRRINTRSRFTPMPEGDKALLLRAQNCLELHKHRAPWVANAQRS